MERKRGGTKVVGGLTMGGVTIGGVTKGGGIDIGFTATSILKKGLISDKVSVATEGMSHVGGV